MGCKQDNTIDVETTSISKKITFNNFKNCLAPGDVVLKRGKGVISQTIVKQLKEPIQLSHCAVVVEKDSLVLVNAISGSISNQDGLQITSITSFYNDAFPESIYILRAYDSKKASKIQKEALRLYKKNIPFDHEFNHLDSSKLYCSEFVENVLHPIYQTSFFGRKKWKNKDILTFNEILYSDFFFIVNQNAKD